MSSHTSNNDPSVSVPLRHLDLSPHRPTTPSNLNDGRTTPQPTEKSSFQPPPPHYASQRVGHDWWMWEVLGFVTSGLSLAAMIGVLVYFDGKAKSSKLPWGITLNSVLSWTATLTKSAMLIPISDGLSQMKWIWFAECNRNLADMDYFEEASRGPYGSMRLLFRLRFRHLGVLGAVVTLFSLAYDPMVQQIVRYKAEINLRPNNTAIVSTADRYGDYHTEVEPLGVFPLAPLPIKAATYAAFYNEHPLKRPYYTCPSDRCNWLSYYSLAVCSRCRNVTGQLKTNCSESSCNTELPNGMSLSGSSGTLMATNTTSKPVYYTNTSSTAHVLGTFQNIAAFNRSRVSNASDLQAEECVLYMCVKEYNSTVFYGYFSENIVNTWPDLDSKATTKPEKDGEQYFYTVAGSQYGMDIQTFDNIKDHLSVLLNGRVIKPSGASRPTFLDSDILQPIWQESSFSEPMSRVADTMTKAVRDGNNTGDGPPHGHQGDAGEYEFYIEVQWVWLIFPIGLFLATAIQLALTIYRTRKTGAGKWRSSALVLAFHGLDRDADEVATARLKGARVANENEDVLLNAAKGMKVKMGRLEDGSTKLISSHAGDRDC